MRSLTVVLVVIGILFGGVSNVLADDLVDPPWIRGDPGTTFQMWEFGDATNPTAPENGYDSPGIPTVTVAGIGPYTQYLPEHFGTGHFGVWKFEAFLEIYIPNIIDNEPLKEIWIQLTYYADSIGQGQYPLFSADGTGLASAQLMSQIQLDDLYYHETYLLTMEPNPDDETIWIQPLNCTFYVDELVIDTISHVPEPATICLLGLGALALLRKRKA